MKKEILKGVIISVSFTLTTLLTIISYGAWVNISNQTNGATINATIWNELVNNMNNIGAKVDTLSNIPTGGVMAFNLSSCPSGWIPANGTSGTPDLRGEFIRGLDSGRGVDTGRTLASTQISTQILVDNDSSEVVGAIDWASNDLNILGYETTQIANGTAVNLHYNTSGWNANAGNTFLRSTRPRNVALLYCVKQ